MSPPALKAHFSLDISVLLVLSALYLRESLRCCLLNQNGCVCRGKENEGMRGRRWCWGDRDGEVFVCTGGGCEWEMSCSDVTSAVSWQDAGMCHTDEGRGRIGEKSKCTMKWFISPPIQSCCFICGHCSVYQTWMLSCCWQRCWCQYGVEKRQMQSCSGAYQSRLRSIYHANHNHLSSGRCNLLCRVNHLIWMGVKDELIDFRLFIIYAAHGDVKWWQRRSCSSCSAWKWRLITRLACFRCDIKGSASWM